MKSVQVEKLWPLIEKSDLKVGVKKKLRLLLNHIRAELENKDFYPITSLHKDDIRAEYERVKNKKKKARIMRKIDQLTDVDMEHITRKMADSWCDNGYWDALTIIFEDYYLKEG
jgi:hypothetical protein